MKLYKREKEIGASEEKKMLANATLMKALGRTLWKVAEAILSWKRQQKEKGSKGQMAPVVLGNDKETANVIAKIMKNRLAKIEELYASHLEKAGVFENGPAKPEPVEIRTKSESGNAGPPAISHTVVKQTTTAVQISSTGEIDVGLSAQEVLQRLGLVGDGVGQAVGVRTAEDLLGSGIAFTASKIILKDLNPPEATIAVTGTMWREGDKITVTKDLVVAVESLVPLDAQPSTEKVGPLLTGYQPHMPRAPTVEHDIAISTLCLLALQMLSQSLAAATDKKVEELIEVVYIPEAGSKKAERGEGLFQCRAKANITQAALRLHPSGGTYLRMDNSAERRSIEKRLVLPPCYIRGVRVSACLHREERQKVKYDFIHYSDMSNKPLAWVNGEDVVEVHALPPFWAVMLAGRDTAHMVNMMPCMEEYYIRSPNPKHYGGWTLFSGMSASMPFLCNTKALEPGDLLVLPFDGGMAEMCCEGFPPIEDPSQQ